MSPASWRAGSSAEHPFVLVVGARARRGTRRHHAAFDRRGVGRAQADGRPELVVRVGIVRVGSSDARGRVRVARSTALETRRPAAAGGGRQRHVRRVTSSEIVVDGHVAAAGRDAEPRDAGQAAVGGRVIGIGGDRLSERVRRPRGRDCRVGVALGAQAPAIRDWRCAGVPTKRRERQPPRERRS